MHSCLKPHSAPLYRKKSVYADTAVGATCHHHPYCTRPSKHHSREMVQNWNNRSQHPPKCLSHTLALFYSPPGDHRTVPFRATHPGSLAGVSERAVDAPTWWADHHPKWIPQLPPPPSASLSTILTTLSSPHQGEENMVSNVVGTSANRSPLQSHCLVHGSESADTR